MLARLFLLCFTTSHVAFLPSPHSYNSKQTWHVVYLSMIFIHAFSNTIIHAVAILQTESAKVETAPTPLSTSRLPPSRSPSFLSGHLLPFSLFPFCVFVFWIVLHLDSSAQIFFVHFLSRIFLPPGPIIGERIGFKGNAYQSPRETVTSNHSAVSLCLSFFPCFLLSFFLSPSSFTFFFVLKHDVSVYMF